ncbi:MAG: glycosyltransferase [Minisyncoccia bacterium]|jgi:glycosyltransferase involved in cell wall biosynthesis
MIKISIIIPTHNRPELLKKAIVSVLGQTFEDFEVVVVDDGLEKRADKIIKEFNDSRIKYIQHQEEKGGSAARNTGIKAASGKFIAFLDDDDEWLPEKLEIQMDKFENTTDNIGFCFSAVTNIYNDGAENSKVPAGENDFFEAALMRAKTFLNVTLIIKRFVFDNIGFFDEQLPSHQESDLVIRMAKKYKGLGIDLPLVRVNMLRDHDSVGKSLKRGIVGKEMILCKHWEDFKNKPNILARRYFELGLSYRNNSQFTKAGDMFEKAMKNDFLFLYLSHYLSMMFSGFMYKLVRKRKLPALKLIALMRTKNSIMVLEDCLTGLSELADEIIVMDNGSTDGSIEVLKKFPKVRVLYRNDNGRFHEGRDMNILLEEAKKKYPDWIFMTWPDEIFEKHLTRGVLDCYMHSGYDRIDFRMCNFWLSTKYCRFDRDWFLNTLRPQRQMWRNLEGSHYNNVFIHPGTIQGINSNIRFSPYRIKHYGYAFKKEADQKARIYKVLDPEEKRQYKYNSGDPEFDANKKNILRYPFIEFDNKAVNYLYIVLFKWLNDVLLIAVNMKRKYLHKLKIFPGETE